MVKLSSARVPRYNLNRLNGYSFFMNLIDIRKDFPLYVSKFQSTCTCQIYSHLAVHGLFVILLSSNNSVYFTNLGLKK